MDGLAWRPGHIHEIGSLCPQIPEFGDPYDPDAYARRVAGRDHLIQLGTVDGEVAGFKIGYALSSAEFYSWLGGVLPWARGRGLAQYLLEVQEALVVARGYSLIRVKSRNQFPAMMRLLLRNGYQISGCEDVGEGLSAHRIHFEKSIAHSGSASELAVVEGQSAKVVLGRRTVTRIPKSAAAAARLRQTARATQLLANHLPVPISQPRLVESADVPGGLLSTEPRLRGEPLTRGRFDALTSTAQDQLISALLEAMRALHRVPLEVARTAGLPEMDGARHWQDVFAQAEPLMVPRLQRHQVDAVAERFREFEQTCRLAPRAVRHGDFGGSNLLVEGSELTGIVDFEQIAVGDPAYDLASLCTVGVKMAEAVRASVDETAARRMDFYQFTFAVQEALWAAESGDLETLDRAIAAYA